MGEDLFEEDLCGEEGPALSGSLHGDAREEYVTRFICIRHTVHQTKYVDGMFMYLRYESSPRVG